jgi:hypothetical protein
LKPCDVYDFSCDDDDVIDLPSIRGADDPDDADKPLCHTHNPYIYCPSCLCTNLIRYRIHELPKDKSENNVSKYAQNYKCKNADCGDEVVFYSFMEQQDKMDLVYEMKTKYNATNKYIAKCMGITMPTVAAYLKEYENLISIKWCIIEKSGMLEEQYDSCFIEEDITAGASAIADTLLLNTKIAAMVCGVAEHEVFGWIIERKEARNKRMLALDYHIQDRVRLYPRV